MVSLMNRITQLIFFFHVTFVQSIWQIQISNEASIKAIEKGKFYDISIFFSEPNPRDFPSVTFKLKNDQNIFKTTQEKYIIDLKKENRIHTMISVSCETQLTEAFLSFEIMSPGQFNSIEYLITFIDPEPFILSLQISSPIISKGEYGIMFLNKYPLNVDRIEIDLKSTLPLLDLEQYIIPPYNPDVLKSNIYAKYSLKNEEEETDSESSTIIPIKAELKASTKCYQLESNALFINIGKNTINSTQGQSVKFQFNPSAGISYLEITLTKYITPSMLYCALVSNNQEFPSKRDIISQDYYHKNDNSTTRYFKSFLFKSMQPPIFSFESLDKFKLYKLRCVYENSASDIKLLTSSSFYSLIPISIAPKESPEAYCATWFLNSIEDKELIETGILSNCETTLVSKIPISEHGCLYCTKRSLEGIIDSTEDIALSTSICLTSTPTCSTKNTKQDTNIYAEVILFQFNTTEEIEEMFQAKIEFAKPIMIEHFDQSAPSQFEFSDIVHKSNHYSFAFSHKTGIPHDCSIELKCENPYITNLKKEEFVLKMNEIKQLVFPIPTGEYDGNNYSLKVICKPLPNLPYHSFKTQFNPLSFSHSKTDECIGKTHLPECYKITYLPMPALLTKNPKQDMDSHIREFNKFDFNQQKKSLNSYLDKYKKIEDEYQVLNTTVMFGEIITYLDCINTQYIACRLLKSDITKEILILLRKHYSDGIIKKASSSTIVHAEEETKTVDKAKLLLMGVYYATINIDAYTNDTSREILEYTSHLLYNSRKLLALVKEELKNKAEKYVNNVNSDLVNLYAAIVDNTINLTEYMQRDDYIFTNHTKYGIVNYDKEILAFTDSISYLIYTSYKYQPWVAYINATNYDMTITPVPQEEIGTIFDFKVNGTNVTISFPINRLFLSLKSRFIGVVYYKKSPFIAYNSTNIYATPIVNIKLYRTLDNDDYDDLSLIDLKTNEEIPFDITYAIDKNTEKPHYCYFINNFTLSTTELITNQYDHKNPLCEMTKIFGDIILGIPDLGGKVKFVFDTWMIVLGVIVFCVIATIVIYLIVFVCQGKKKAENLIEINHQSTSHQLYNEEDIHSGN